MSGNLDVHGPIPQDLPSAGASRGEFVLARKAFVPAYLTDQYHPAHKAQTQPRFADINRRLRPSELRQALGYAAAAGLCRLDARRPF